MNKGDIFEVKIEKLLYEGAGLAHIDNFVIFVEKACDEDILEIEITSAKKNFARAKILRIIKPSKYRIENLFCAMANVCGGCQWSFIKYEHQLEIKKQIIEDALKKVLPEKIKVQDTIPSEKISHFRHKIQLPVSQTKNSKRFIIGYYKPLSHEIVNIKHCEIQPESIDEIVEFIRNNAKELNITAYDEKKHKGLLRHVILRISKENGEILVTFVLNSQNINSEIKKLAENLSKKFKKIIGCCANFNTQKNNIILGKMTKTISGKGFYTDKLGNKYYQISVNSFFQTNPYIAEKFLEVIKKDIEKNFKKPIILDAYAGISTFGIYLSDIASKIVCVESEKSSCEDAKNSFDLNKTNNIKLINDDASKVFEDLIKNKNNFDISIIDPPRRGSTPEGLKNLCDLTSKTIYYISCNPQTLARDAEILKQNGFELSFVQGADMFPHSYHIETIAKFDRQ